MTSRPGWEGAEMGEIQRKSVKTRGKKPSLGGNGRKAAENGRKKAKFGRKEAGNGLKRRKMG